MATRKELITVAGREVTISNPDKVYFPEAGYTKRDLVSLLPGRRRRGAARRGRAAHGPQAVRGGRGGRLLLPEAGARPRGPTGSRRWSCRSPRAARPMRSWSATRRSSCGWSTWAASTSIRTPSGRRTWTIPTSCASTWTRCPACPGTHIRQVALVTREALADLGLVGWPKTSGSRGIHINVRIEPEWTFPEVRRAALALARDVERRVPALATSKWWKEERHGVFLDYNQNAKDRTVASAYSVRPTPDARVSAPLTWDEVPQAELADFTLATVPARFAAIGDPGGRHRRGGRVAGVAAGAVRAPRDGRALATRPWPPNYARTLDEPPRVQPSKRRMSSKPLIEIGRAAKQAGGDGGPQALEGAPPGRLAAPRAGRRAGRRDARPLHDLDAHPRQPGARPARAAAAPGGPWIPTTTPGPA